MTPTGPSRKEERDNPAGPDTRASRPSPADGESNDGDGNPFAAPRTDPQRRAAVEGQAATFAKSEIPASLYRDRAFWGMTATQFLGAFNDNLFKQLILLLAITVAIDGAGETTPPVDLQWLATLAFSLPFLMFSGYAGYLSDRYSKRPVIVLAKVAEIVAMLLGAAAFAWEDQFGYAGLIVVLFLMGAQGAFFGPAKYGILPEMLHEHDLPRANGIFLMTTFIAIIFGTASAGFVKEHFGDRRWVASSICVGIAVAGTLTSLLVRRLPAARPDLKFTTSALVIAPDIRQLLRRDHPLLAALLVSSIFWLMAAVAQQSVNSLGLVQLRVGDQKTSFLNAAIGVGIAMGCFLAGMLSAKRVNFRVMLIGAWGLVATLAILSLSKRGGDHWLGFAMSLPVLVMLGVFTGMFAVPIQVFMQSRPPEGQKGRMVAAMNLFNWIGVCLASPVYFLFGRAVDYFALPRSVLFACTASLMLPIALFYHPADQKLK